jgi:hypothetical protein
VPKVLVGFAYKSMVARAVVRLGGVGAPRADVALRGVAVARAVVALFCVVAVRARVVLRNVSVVVARAGVVAVREIVAFATGREMDFALRSAALTLPTPAINAMMKNIILSIIFYNNIL